MTPLDQENHVKSSVPVTRLRTQGLTPLNRLDNIKQAGKVCCALGRPAVEEDRLAGKKGFSIDDVER